jgi:hypothetical protein
MPDAHSMPLPTRPPAPAARQRHPPPRLALSASPRPRIPKHPGRKRHSGAAPTRHSGAAPTRHSGAAPTRHSGAATAQHSGAVPALRLRQPLPRVNVATWRAAALHPLLRVAVGLCFIGHGAFGIITKEAWLPYFGLVGIGPALAFRLMPVIGLVDILIGLAVLIRPLRATLLYAVLWCV